MPSVVPPLAAATAGEYRIEYLLGCSRACSDSHAAPFLMTRRRCLRYRPGTDAIALKAQDLDHAITYPAGKIEPKHPIAIHCKLDAGLVPTGFRSGRGF